MTVAVRRAAADELPRVRDYLATWGYRGEVGDADLCFVALDGDVMVGVVRLAREDAGTWVLRGMRVSPAWHRRRVGSRLLALLDEALGGAECYCIPYAHLVGFYGQIGFRVLDEAHAPEFLRRRLAAYRERSDGESYLVMHRPARPA